MVDVIRFWKDPEYRARAGRGPENPAGVVELSDDQLKQASGVATTAATTCLCCTDTSRFRRCCP
jgi:mersacidin/lichenicidin family type 2 lantibiotic